MRGIVPSFGGFYFDKKDNCLDRFYGMLLLINSIKEMIRMGRLDFLSEDLNLKK